MNAIKLMAMFEGLTKAKIKDMILTDAKVFFVVQENEIAKAIGKEGINVKRLEARLNKRVRIIEYSGDVKRFIANVIFPLKVANIEEREKTYLLTPMDARVRKLLIGRAAVNLRLYESIIKRFYDIK